MRRTYRLLSAACCLFLAALLVLSPGGASGQQIFQYGFEARGPVWKPGSTDTTSKVLKHELTDETAHMGQRSEHIQLQVEKGSYIHYTFDLPQAPITEELNLSLYLKSNRPGIQLLCRFVLPQEKDPANLAQPLTVLVRCTPYEGTRWKLVSLNQPVKRLREQQQLLTNKLGRDVVSAGAYIDQLVLNVYDGPGLTDVWIDDLEVGPVLENKTITPAPKSTGPREIIAEPAIRRSGEVELRGNQLLVSGKRFLMLGIRHTGTPLKTIREAGFNTVWLDEATPPGLVEDAVNLGFWLVPSIHRQTAVVAGPWQVNGQLTSADVFAQKLSRFQNDAVLAWDLGTNLEAETFTDVARFARGFRNADLQQPVIADVRDGYKGYALSLDPMLLGTHRWPLMTSMELGQYRKWLVARRQLSLENYSWTWIQTHLPPWYAQLMGQDPEKSNTEEMLGPQPEQIRLLAYTALAAGYRGLAFWSDRSLADSHQGRDRLLAMALLNQELRLLEPVLVQANGPPEWIPTRDKNVHAAVFRTPAGMLVLPIWHGPGSQYVPAQAASATLTLTIPGVPITAMAWEVSPGRLQSYPMRREAGGAMISLHNFSLTSALLITSDLSPTGMIVHLQDQQRNLGPRAAQWLHDQAQAELTKVERVQTALERLGHTLPDAQALLQKARQALDLCMQDRRNGEHTAAYNQAEVALRALRTLMRAHWEKAVRDLDTPVASPYAVSFYTLPRHWQFVEELRRSVQPTRNVLPDGGFETPTNQLQTGWIVQEVPSLDAVTQRVSRVAESAHMGRQCVKITITPKDPKKVPESLERAYIALHSPAVQLPPGTLVRISAWVRIPVGIQGSTDGAMIYDNIGGEPLAVRLTEPTKTNGKTLGWQRFMVYRRVPASGAVSVTLALSGMGTVYFDDVHVEPFGSAVSRQ
jgi:hypothetical protein